MNIQQICVLDHLLRVLDSDDLLNGHLIPPEVMTTEQDYSDLWQGECKCECEWSNEKSQKQRRSRPKSAVSKCFLHTSECRVAANNLKSTYQVNFSFLPDEDGMQVNDNLKIMEYLQQLKSTSEDSDDENDFFVSGCLLVQPFFS